MNRVGKVSIAIPLVEDVRTSNKKSSMDGLGLRQHKTHTVPSASGDSA